MAFIFTLSLEVVVIFILLPKPVRDIPSEWCDVLFSVFSFWNWMRSWILGEEENLGMIVYVCCVERIWVGLDIRCFTFTCILVLFCCVFIQYSSWSWNVCCCRLSLVWLRNDVIEVGLHLAMIWISVAGITLWLYLRAVVVEAILFNVTFLFKWSVRIIFFAILSHFCNSITVHLLN